MVMFCVSLVNATDFTVTLDNNANQSFFTIWEENDNAEAAPSSYLPASPADVSSNEAFNLSDNIYKQVAAGASNNEVYHMFEANLTGLLPPDSTLTLINWTWEGKESDGTRTSKIYLWNFTSESYKEFHSFSSGLDITLSSFPSDVLNFIDLSSNLTAMIVHSVDFTQFKDLKSDFFKLEVTYTLDTTPPNITINFPLNQTYNTNSITFNITSNDDISGVNVCQYSLTAGATNFTMSNTTAIAYNATNTSIAQGSYLANFYCNDTAGNLNNSESVAFTLGWGGSLFNRIRLNENSGTIAYDVSGQSNNGTITGATWNYDGINITLTETTDYTRTGTDFIVVNQNYSWREIITNYDYAIVVSSPATTVFRLIGVFIALIMITFILAPIIEPLKEFFS